MIPLERGARLWKDASNAGLDAGCETNFRVWAAGLNSDLVSRIDTNTGDAVEYLLPRETNVRRAFVDNCVNPPVFWVGNHHLAGIVKVEPLD